MLSQRISSSRKKKQTDPPRQRPFELQMTNSLENGTPSAPREQCVPRTRALICTQVERSGLGRLKNHLLKCFRSLCLQRQTAGKSLSPCKCSVLKINWFFKLSYLGAGLCVLGCCTALQPGLFGKHLPAHLGADAAGCEEQHQPRMYLNLFSSTQHQPSLSVVLQCCIKTDCIFSYPYPGHLSVWRHKQGSGQMVTMGWAALRVFPYNRMMLSLTHHHAQPSVWAMEGLLAAQPWEALQLCQGCSKQSALISAGSSHLHTDVGNPGGPWN